VGDPQGHAALRQLPAPGAYERTGKAATPSRGRCSALIRYPPHTRMLQLARRNSGGVQEQVHHGWTGGAHQQQPLCVVRHCVIAHTRSCSLDLLLYQLLWSVSEEGASPRESFYICRTRATAGFGAVTAQTGIGRQDHTGRRQVPFPEASAARCITTRVYCSWWLCLARCVKTNFPKTGGGKKLRIFSENRGRPVALSQKTEGGPSRVECDLARLLRFEWRCLVAEIQPIGRGSG
jgi:hypothetical protein